MDLDAFVERAAIKEYCGGLSRFQAETEAAEAQGFKRWEVLNAISKRDSGRGGNIGQAHGGNTTDNLPGMQRGAKEEGRSLLGGDVQAGRNPVVLSPLRV